jgi:hypothetical protein
MAVQVHKHVLVNIQVVQHNFLQALLLKTTIYTQVAHITLELP